MDRYPNAEYPDPVDPDTRIPYWKADLVAGAAERGEDDDLTDRIDQDGWPTTDPSGILADRRDRTVLSYYQHADGRWLPSLIKEGDDISWYGLPLRVVGAARQRNCVSCYYAPWFSDAIIPVDISTESVLDRAPLDPNETPMPVIPVSP